MRSPRRSYQRRVGSLLSAIDERHTRQLALAARGVKPMGMRELEQEIQALRDELAAVIAAGSDAPAPVETPQELPMRRFAKDRRSRSFGLRPAATAHFAAHS